LFFWLKAPVIIDEILAIINKKVKVKTIFNL